MAQYLMPAARCEETGQLVKKQDLSGARYTRFRRDQAWSMAQVLAEDMSQRHRQTWVPELIEYN